MSDMLSEEERRALGLHGGAALDWVAIPLPDSGVAHGLVAEATTFVADILDSTDGRFIPVNEPALEHAGVTVARLSTRPHVLRLVASDGERLDLMATRSLGPERVLRDDVDDATVFIETADGDALAARPRQGEAVVVKREGNVIHIAVVGRSPDVLVPPGAWASILAGCADGWILEEIATRRRRNDAWHDIVAVGMLQRLRDDWTSEQIAAAVNLARRGQHAPERVPAALVVAGWSDDQCRIAAEALLAEIDSLHRVLLFLLDADESANGAWQRAFVRHLERRDDVESALVVMRAAARREPRQQSPPGWCMATETAVQAFDAEARTLALAAGPVPDDGSEQLRRALVRMPEAWWVRPLVLRAGR